jgi:hypothetical protein
MGTERRYQRDFLQTFFTSPAAVEGDEDSATMLRRAAQLRGMRAPDVWVPDNEDATAPSMRDAGVENIVDVVAEHGADFPGEIHPRVVWHRDDPGIRYQGLQQMMRVADPANGAVEGYHERMTDNRAKGMTGIWSLTPGQVVEANTESLPSEVGSWLLDVGDRAVKLEREDGRQVYDGDGVELEAAENGEYVLRVAGNECVTRPPIRPHRRRSPCFRTSTSTAPTSTRNWRRCTARTS